MPLVFCKSTYVFRSGNPLLIEDLERVSCGEARSIIVLATTGSPQQSDARVLRITLSLLGLHDRLRSTEGGSGLQVEHPDTTPQQRSLGVS